MTDEPSTAVTPEILDTVMHPLDPQSLQPSWKFLTSLLHLDSDPRADQELAQQGSTEPQNTNLNAIPSEVDKDMQHDHWPRRRF